MQTFLPYGSFSESAAVLDRARLGKQRAECIQIMQALTDPTKKGWRRHPAVQMWRGHLMALADYGMLVTEEWLNRGYRDSGTAGKLWLCVPEHATYTLPPWLGNELFHSTHRAALLAKDFEHYSQFGWLEQPQIDYLWPVFHGDSLILKGFERRG